jgi:3-oxoacyl-[acyl-carrier protein] reductase
MGEFDLAGKVALVTGAGQGIGAATATLLARAGAAVVLAEVNPNSGNRIAEEIQHAGGEARYVHTDVRVFDQVQRAVNEALVVYGRIDILVNNAGYYDLVQTLDMTEADINRMMAVNLTGVHHCCRAALPSMLERGRGSIIFLASIAGITGTWGRTAHYAASKGAVIAYMRSLAREFGPHGIRVNAIAPGQIDTPMSRLRLTVEPDYLERIAQEVPLRRIGRPIEVAYAILFLASDAASYITGQVLQVCGGYLMA